MLQSLREKKSGFLVKVVLGIIVIGFSFFGIESYFVGNTDVSVAKVGDREISQDEFRQRFEDYRQQMMRMMGDAADGSFFQRPEVKRQVLDQMINEELLLAANAKLGINIPAARLQSEIAAIPAFQTEGRFDPDVYRTILAGQGMSPRGFEERVRRDLAVRELPTQIISTGFVSNAEVDTFLRLRNQVRDFHFVRLDRPAPADTEVTDAQVQEYYDAHTEQFTMPERVALDFIELDSSRLQVNTTADEATLKDVYEKQKTRFVGQEQRLASHILIKVGGNGSPEEQKAALAKAEKIVAEARAGKDFAELAKEDSDDVGSKNLGGDLGWIEHGMTDPAFEAALFAMKKGEISAPILSPEGYHIVDLRDIREGKTRTFDEVKGELEQEFANSERERVYNEKSGRLIDLTYQDPSTLDSAGKELDLPVQKTALFTQQGGADPITQNPNVLKAAFSNEVKVEGNNSDPIELGPNHIVVIRLAERKAPEPIPLTDVRTQIQGDIVAERVAKQAKDRTAALFAKLGPNTDLAKLASQEELTVETETGIGRQAENLDNALVQAVFSMPRPQDGVPEYREVALGADAYALVQLDKVVDADPSTLDEKTREAARDTLVQGVDNSAVADFVDALRKQTKVVINEKNL